MTDCYWTDIKDAIRIRGHSRTSALVCPCCKDHKQLKCAERGKDCKNLIVEEGKPNRQCNCWSEAHG